VPSILIKEKLFLVFIYRMYGDTRSNPLLHDRVMNQLLYDVDQADDRQTVILHSGDFVNAGDEESNWDLQFFSPFTPRALLVQSRLPIMGVRGNHESSHNHLMKKYYAYNYPVEAAGKAGFYSFNYGPIHVTMIDSEESFAVGSPQYVWIENDLSTDIKPWKIVVFHRPGWSASGTSASPGRHTNNLSVQQHLQPLFEQHNVKLVFNGDNHYYARVRVDSQGLFYNYHITTGGGGAPLYIPNTVYSSNYSNAYTGVIQASSSNRHFCRLEITDSPVDRCDLTVINEDGAIIDTLSVEL
jgi:hypothetical protein